VHGVGADEEKFGAALLKARAQEIILAVRAGQSPARWRVAISAKSTESRRQGAECRPPKRARTVSFKSL